MMEELKAYRRELSLRLAKAEREGRFMEVLHRICRGAMRKYRAELEAIRREDAAARRRARRASARGIESSSKVRRALRAPNRRK